MYAYPVRKQLTDTFPYLKYQVIQFHSILINLGLTFKILIKYI